MTPAESNEHTFLLDALADYSHNQLPEQILGSYRFCGQELALPIIQEEVKLKTELGQKIEQQLSLEARLLLYKLYQQTGTITPPPTEEELQSPWDQYCSSLVHHMQSPAAWSGLMVPTTSEYYSVKGIMEALSQEKGDDDLYTNLLALYQMALKEHLING